MAPPVVIRSVEVTATTRIAPRSPSGWGERVGLRRRIETTEIELSDQAREYVAAHGGTLYLRVRHNRCCSGGLTFLDAATSAHRDDDRYERLSGEKPEVRLFHLGSVLPSKVSVEVRGKVRKHLVAYWDGCAYRL